ncbi:MAG TPA: 2Fe-2S iron-sulfur cluster-binding protein [Steroidobacteraceae bacterium]|jgi:heterotetrameric sarcosine oxidase alpha subunit|nr:2Fe-2S iron-sulfur cluster-binding protein [Steroidobacteraceae bacterium]
MSGPARIAPGLLTQAHRPVGFRFDGQPLVGLAGDTLASALLANGRHLVGRSFKYHRPRGIVTAGPEEPCALVDVLGAGGREPNQLATTLPLTQDLNAVSQNRWPALGFDLLALNDLIGRFLPAGFYYKTFMAPGWAWERLYEPLIRRAAGLGRLEASVAPHAAPAEIVHDHADVLVVGGGSAGLTAARLLAAGGLRVLLAEQDVVLGGGTLLDDTWEVWRQAMLRQLKELPGARCLTRTTILGAYGHGVFGALETLTAEESARFGGLRERLRVVRARRVLLSCGAVERLVAFPGNDLPGVMLTGAVRAYLRRYGVATGLHPAFFLNNDEAYAAVFALRAAGVRPAAVIDPRPAAQAAARARDAGIEVLSGALVTAVLGGHGVRGIRVARADGSTATIEADCLGVSGGYSPTIALASQLGARPEWQEDIAAFTAALPLSVGQVAGAARGVFGLAAAARDAQLAARRLASDLGRPLPQFPAAAPMPPDAEHSTLAPLWEVRTPGKAFVDLQNDVTADDVRLACREGYEHVEHMKRYTTCGMATDQGRIGGLVASAVLAGARGVPLAEVGQAKPRPYAQPVPFAALAGGEVREHYKPKRRLPLHDWHERAGATFVNTGLWLRPLVYSRASGWQPVLDEARAVRRTVGITDLSTLGKLDVQGADAARFLDFIYANTFSTLPVGRARYGIMLREDGMLLDDGTTSRFAPGHFVVTTTTANSAAVLEHLEFHHQAVCPDLDVVLTDVCDQWAQFAVAGPRAREVVAAVVPGLDLSNAAFPFMAVAAASIAGVPGRLFRISFSGELAYELAVPASTALAVWEAVLASGARFGIRPYGLDALNTLRIEKGHVTTAELNGNTSAADLGFERLLKKSGDFIGRALSARPALTDDARLQLVGVRPLARSQRLRNGMQLIAPENPAESLGYLTSSTPSVELGGWVGLALLAGGRKRIGTRLLGSSPIHGERTELEILSPHLLDPENLRVRS